ncbi:MAG: hypothetical protein H6965_11870 [Chromatiaceae bacterium]|nr:hypothetical protein [Chromatiaceae bacterium]
MKTGMKKLAVFVAVVSFAAAVPAWASGGKNAYNNPNGSPADEVFEAPYTNLGEGRVMLFCAEDEKLVVTPIDKAAVEATCVPDDE